LRDYIEERALNIANYIIECNATVRQTAKAFGVSKSTVHVDVEKWNGLCGWWNDGRESEVCVCIEAVYLRMVYRFC